ncbi:acyl-CoA dehydrogenase [Cupriavidus sp. 30B13]|uniref:acyl-CoA dehydrogenase n=1 Tax=Cupriavidus sp. 30B13 TaxID=3384241 RepID=UPI003B913DCB
MPAHPRADTPAAPAGEGADIASRFARLAREPDLPLPGAGRTWLRWLRLAEVAAEDVSLVKLFEAHADALAIMAELGAPPPPPGSRWGVWAAEPPDAQVVFHAGGDTPDRLDTPDRPARGSLRGRKAWCSGAPLVTHALLTCRDEREQRCLAVVALDAPGVRMDERAWQSPAMRAARTADIDFDGTPARRLGAANAYLERPGFWHGGAGIAACWLGAAVPLALALRGQVARRAEPHAAAHLGAVDLALHAGWAQLREAAAWIDSHPAADAAAVAMRTRLAAEHAAGTVIEHAGRALGAGPLCRDAALAARFCDLPVFLRQSHAERDLAALGALLCGPGASTTAWAPWQADAARHVSGQGQAT